MECERSVWRRLFPPQSADIEVLHHVVVGGVDDAAAHLVLPPVHRHRGEPPALLLVGLHYRDVGLGEAPLQKICCGGPSNS